MASGPVAIEVGNPSGEVRPEDAFDIAAVHTWLAARVPELAGQTLPTVSQFGGGASNLTYALAYPNLQLVLRRPPVGTKAAGAHDMSREYEIQRLLRPHFPAVPEVLAHCPAEGSPLGGEFYVMVRAEGTILRADLPPGMTVEPADAARLGLGMFDLLADLHSVDVESAGLSGFYRGPGYVERQVSGWSRRYRNALTDDAPGGEDVMTWLSTHQPSDSGECLIHGDWRFDNMVLAPVDLTVRAVLDWELATVGDPLMDLGASLAYWVQADDDEVFRLFRRQPSNIPGMPSREQIVDNYLARTGRTLDSWRFYEVYGLFRLAVIAQQIWYRYANGQTTNPAFAQFGPAVHYLLDRCAGLTRTD